MKANNQNEAIQNVATWRKFTAGVAVAALALYASGARLQRVRLFRELLPSGNLRFGRGA
jgi:hypothetical protein